jgi:uncharacterized protein
MYERPFWLSRLGAAWDKAPITWLAGVRRSGKTTLARLLDPAGTTYVNCEDPDVARRVAKPSQFYRSLETAIVVFDEVHQLRDPARLLKLGADEFRDLKILATGSSTLVASAKFRDTLTGRKRTVHLLPVLVDELGTFGGCTLERRLLHGGLPDALVARDVDAGFYREWVDSFFARDIQRLYGFRDVNRFSLLFEYVCRQSGGQFDAAKASRALGMARTTVNSHLQALELTYAAAVVRPFHGNSRAELVKAPKVYAFDTGFVCWARGWHTLRSDDLGPLWEHVVLEHLQAKFPDQRVRYWRQWSGTEIDFVLERGRDEVDAIECKWDAGRFDARALKAFRASYPHGRNFVVTPDSGSSYVTNVDGLEVVVGPPSALTAGEGGDSSFVVRRS